MNGEATLKFINDNALSLEDTFDFTCKQCGKCCHNRTDLLLTPYDIYRIAKYFGHRCNDIIEKYCDVIMGEKSKMPVVQVCPNGTKKSCPFLQDRKCCVHQVKPILCAVYPLGRAQIVDEGEKFFISDVKCGKIGRPMKVIDWISQFQIIPNNPIAKLLGSYSFLCFVYQGLS